jgi:glutathione synthase/RimK-type ligase-like ATP-grasp enzyme
VWLRQPDPPAHHPAKGDGEAFPSGYAAFFRALAYMLERLPVRCVNSYSASCLVRNKGVQLHLAAASGLKVPATLLSNCPAAVRGFFDQNPSNAICKAFASHIWQQGSGDIAVTETFSLSREQLPPEDEVFTYAPAIYQQIVPKQFDVRTVLMGDRIYSFALRTPENSLDWRHDAALHKIRVEIVSTPADVQAGILGFARKAGVCFGSMDFAVDRNADWWFLEINEQGQFLWVDQFLPHARLQQKFCAFLTAPPGSAQSLEERQHLFPSAAEYEQSHQDEEVTDILKVSPGSSFKSVEP